MISLPKIPKRFPAAPLPLFVRELDQQASKRVTWVLRFLGAGVLFWMMLSAMPVFRPGVAAASTEMLGAGGQYFGAMTLLLTFAVLLLVPGSVGTAVASERERGTLPLLLVTGLSPTRIVFEKMLARILPVLSLLLLCMPIAALAYALGGLRPVMLVATAYCLFLGTVQIACIAAFCAASCRTVAAGQLSAYFVGAMVLGVILVLVPLFHIAVWVPIGSGFLFVLSVVFDTRHGVESMFDVATGGAWESLGELWFQTGFPPSMPGLLTGAGLSLAGLLWLTMPHWLVCFVLIRLAGWRLSYSMRKELSGSRSVRSRSDHTQVAMGRLLPGDRRTLPDEQPIAWRQKNLPMNRLGRLMFASALTVAGLISFSTMPGVFTRRMDALQWSQFLAVTSLAAWAVGSLSIILHAASTFSAERGGDTLDVLLTTPVRTREMIRQKMVVVRRWVLMVGVAVVVLAAIRAVTVAMTGQWTGFAILAALVPLACAILGAVIYLPLLAWVSLMLGMQFDGASKATTVTLTVIGAYLAASAAIPGSLLEDVPAGVWIQNLMLVSPATILFDQFVALDDSPLAGPAWLRVAMNYAFWAGVLWWVRKGVLKRADGLLGRVG